MNNALRKRSVTKQIYDKQSSLDDIRLKIKHN